MKYRTVKVVGIAAAFAAIAAPALADGDAEAGKKIFNRCKACHTLAEGKNRVGPSLHGVVGRPAGSLPGFKYSKAMKESGLTWNEDTLKKFLASPKKLVPGTRMTFPGLKKEQDIEDVIAYLKANGG